MRRPKWTTVVVAIALVAALAIAAPVFGGNSIKKLVKKEVAKQIGKATGPQGPAGPAGQDGTAKAGARVIGTTAAFTSGTNFGGIEATKSAAGGYCIRVPFTPRNVVVTVTDNTKHARAQLTSEGGFGTCNSSLPGYQAWVTTHLNSTEGFSDTDFFVLIN